MNPPRSDLEIALDLILWRPALPNLQIMAPDFNRALDAAIVSLSHHALIAHIGPAHMPAPDYSQAGPNVLVFKRRAP